jgi:hypothetical protein
MPTVGVDRFEEDRAAREMISHTMEMMLAALSVIWGVSSTVIRACASRFSSRVAAGSCRGWTAWTPAFLSLAFPGWPCPRPQLCECAGTMNFTTSRVRR